MSEQFKVIDLPGQQLEEELNQLGIEGWKALNCWPIEKNAIRCVLTRTFEYWCSQSKSFKPARALGYLDLKVALARCLENPAPRGKLPSIRLSDLGKEFAADQEQVLEQMKRAGLKRSEKLAHAHAAFVDDYLLIVSDTPDKSGAYWLNLKSVKRDSPARQAPITFESLHESSTPVKPRISSQVTKPGKSVPQTVPRQAAPPPPDEPLTENQSESHPQPKIPDRAGRQAAVRQTAIPQRAARETELDIKNLLDRCMQEPQKEAGWPHSISLSVLGKESGVNASEVLDFLVRNSIPEQPQDPNLPYVEVDGRFVKLKQSGRGWYLQVLPRRQSKST